MVMFFEELYNVKGLGCVPMAEQVLVLFVFV
jgi:hypothetical protein